MAGRPRALDAEAEALLDRLLELGLTQRAAAAALGVSIRTVQRFEQERRQVAAAAPRDFDERLGEYLATDVSQTLGPPPKPKPRSRGRRRRSVPDWRASARRLAALYPERWDTPPDRLTGLRS